MAKIGIAGASGYTGLELLRLLLKHPEAEVTFVSSQQYEGKRVSEVFPSFSGFSDLEFVALDSPVANDCDILFLALPHTTAMHKVPGYLAGGSRVIDLSADYRLKDAATFEEWYATPHVHPEILKEAVYGLPEVHRERIKSARLVANPGCYPTSIILGLAPILTSGWGDLSSIIADSKSGVSGAGRKASLATQFSECNESVSAYNLAIHRHTPEIEQELSGIAGDQITLSFSPHLMPMTRGMLSTIYVNLKRTISPEDLTAHYREFYKNEPFVRVLKSGTYASTRFVSGSNFCDIGVQVDVRNQRAIITSAIDNLVKGASGQAVQNMNLLLGIDEKTALDAPGMFP